MTDFKLVENLSMLSWKTCVTKIIISTCVLDILVIFLFLLFNNVPDICFIYFCSIDEQVAKDIQLIDSIAEKQALIFSEECKLFPADVQIQSIYPL